MFSFILKVLLICNWKLYLITCFCLSWKSYFYVLGNSIYLCKRFL